MTHYPEERFCDHAETRKIVTCFYIDSLNVQLVSTHVHFADLLSSYIRVRSLDDCSDQGVTLLGVCEALAVEDPKFSVLLDKSEDDDCFVGDRRSGEGREHN